MRHLSDETLARLVDEEPTEVEEAHLRSCTECAGILRDLRRQTEALASLPALRPATDGWQRLEARLRSEGLVDDSSVVATDRNRRPRRFPQSSWLQAAAALLLFLGGATFGARVEPDVATWMDGDRGGEPAARLVGAGADTTVAAAGTGGVSGVDEAESRLRSAEERYVDALITYRELLRDSGDGISNGVDGEDPASRFAALEALVAASQEAIRQAPADPFFNGVLASTMAERRAAIRQISSSTDDSWF